MKFLSIDQSLSSSGVIVWDTEGKIHSFKLINTPTKEEVILRIRAVRKELLVLIKEHDIKHIVIESLPFGLNSTSVRPLAALYYCIQNVCIDATISFSEANVTAVKKLATGSGKAKKEDMIKALQEQDLVLHNSILLDGIKKTTGLADLADSYFIGKFYLHTKDKDESNT